MNQYIIKIYDCDYTYENDMCYDAPRVKQFICDEDACLYAVGWAYQEGCRNACVIDNEDCEIAMLEVDRHV